MHSNNLKRLRNEKELTQKQISKLLCCNRSTYNNWERGVIIIPLDIADKLSVFYKVNLSCVLGINKKIIYNENIKPLDYNKLLKKLCTLKKNNKYTYDNIGLFLGCTGATCQRYFNGTIKIPVDRLILLSKLYKIDIDDLCFKNI